MTILSTGCPLNVSHVQSANATLPDGQVVRCRVVNILHDGIVHVVHEHEVRGPPAGRRTLRRVRQRSALRALPRSEDVKDPPVDLRPPLTTMTARPVPQLPDEHHSGSLTFEPKLDGWRCVAFHRLTGRVALQSRQQKTLTPYFPEIVAAIVQPIPAGPVLDGELVVYRDGRCDFAALEPVPRIMGRGRGARS